MYEKLKQCLPLSTLPAFEASARLLSFTKAGQELHLSQAAISQQIKHLENNLGVDLFERMPRKIKLTEQGQKFQHTVSVVMELLDSSTQNLQSTNYNFGLTIAADISMAHMWLLPNFPSFGKAFPDIDVSIFASEQESECLKPGIDLALLYGNGSWDGFDAQLLIEEEVFPVCSPAYMETLSKYSHYPNFEYVLFDLNPMRWDWVDWQHLLSQHQLFKGRQVRFYQFNSMPLLTQATVNGEGIGLGWKTLVDEHLKRGELIRPFDVSLKTNRGYYVLKPVNATTTAKAQHLYDWIVNTCV